MTYIHVNFCCCFCLNLLDFLLQWLYIILNYLFTSIYLKNILLVKTAYSVIHIIMKQLTLIAALLLYGLLRYTSG